MHLFTIVILFKCIGVIMTYDYVLKFICKKEGGVFMEETSRCYKAVKDKQPWPVAQPHKKTITYKNAHDLLVHKVYDIQIALEARAPPYCDTSFELKSITMFPDWILDDPIGASWMPEGTKMKDFFKISLTSDFYSTQRQWARDLQKKCDPIQHRGFVYNGSIATPQIVRELRFIRENFCTKEKCLFPVVLQRKNYANLCQHVYFRFHGNVTYKFDYRNIAKPIKWMFPKINFLEIEFSKPYTYIYKKEYCMNAMFLGRDEETIYLARYLEVKNGKETEVPINFRIFSTGQDWEFMSYNLNMSGDTDYSFYDQILVGLNETHNLLQPFTPEEGDKEFNLVCQYDSIDQFKIAKDLEEEETLKPKELCDLLQEQGLKTKSDGHVCTYLMRNYIIPDSVMHYDNLSSNCLGTFGYPPRLGTITQGEEILNNHIHEMEKMPPFNITTAVVVGAMPMLDGDYKHKTKWYYFGDLESGIGDEVSPTEINYRVNYDMVVEWNRRIMIGDNKFIKNVDPEPTSAIAEMRRRMDFPFLARLMFVKPTISDYAKEEKNMTMVTINKLVELRFDYFYQKHPTNFLCQIGPDKREDNPLLTLKDDSANPISGN